MRRTRVSFHIPLSNPPGLGLRGFKKTLDFLPGNVEYLIHGLMVMVLLDKCTSRAPTNVPLCAS